LGSGGGGGAPKSSMVELRSQLCSQLSSQLISQLSSATARSFPDANTATTTTVSSHRVMISEPGNHLAVNAAAAAAVSLALGLSFPEVCRDVSQYKSLEMRMRVHNIPARGIVCVDDAYNASPVSVMNALQTLQDERTVKRRTVVLLGDMLELGAASQRYHEEILNACLDRGFDLIGLAGPQFSRACGTVSRKRDVTTVVKREDAEQLWEKVKDAMDPGSVVLVKGSRGMRMDSIVKRLTE